MKHTLLMPILLLLALAGLAQTTVISGKVLDNRKRPVSGASISLKDTYDGATTDSAGNFKFTTTEKGNQTIVVTAMNFKTFEQLVSLTGTAIEISALLKESPNELTAVVITAGSFEASDEKKVTVLKPLDIVTTASANADVASAMKTLPGTQQVGESAELFVRGGDGSETRQFIDGTTVANPFFAGPPNIATRGRFSPFLFKGTVFSTGGYSALYGQALSSALILESIDLPERREASLSISPLFLGGQYQHLAKNKKSSFGGSVGYTNIGPYFGLVKQTPDYFKAPVFYNGDFNFRIKTSKTGILKLYAVYNSNNLGLRNPDIDSAALKGAFTLRNSNLYTNLSYKERLGNGWKMQLGLGFSINKDKISSEVQDANNNAVPGANLPFYIASKNFNLNSRNTLTQAKLVFDYKLKGLSAIRFGTEYWFSRDYSDYNNFVSRLDDHFNALFAESDIYITNDIAAKVGARYEHSSLMKRGNIAPRASVAYKINRTSQVSVDYGIFYQKPLANLMIFNRDLDYLQATHYIATYQKTTATQTFRTQAFYKKYNQLVTTKSDTSNGGSGYAQGIEFFWRDKKTLKDFDYWITYSYLDTKREYLNYPYSITPNFAAKHTANFVIKRFFTKMKTQLNANYQFATGRPYYDIRYNTTQNKYVIRDQGTTRTYNSLSFSANYLTPVLKGFGVIVFSVTNVLGSKQVFNYNYSYSGANKVEVTQPARRFFFLGLFVSWGTDRTQDAINNNM